MNAADLIQDPSLVLDIPDYDLELTAREVVEVFAASNAFASPSSDEVAERVMRFVGVVSKRNPELSCAIIQAYAEMGGNVNSLVKTATRLKNDPEVHAFLDYLRANIAFGLTRERFIEGRKIVRRSMEVGCAWAGLDARQTRMRVKNLVPER